MLVRLMKYSLPVAAVLLIGMIFLTGHERNAVLDTGSLVDAAMINAGLELKDPEFAGMTDDGDPFVIKAKTALPDGAMPERVDLVLPQGEIRVSEDLLIDIRSDVGEFFRSKNLLLMSGDVVLTTSDGYTVRGPNLDLKMQEKVAVVTGSVDVETDNGTITADRLTVTQGPGGRGDTRFLFEGSVRVFYQPEAATN